MQPQLIQLQQNMYFLGQYRLERQLKCRLDLRKTLKKLQGKKAKFLTWISLHACRKITTDRSFEIFTHSLLNFLQPTRCPADWGRLTATRICWCGAWRCPDQWSKTGSDPEGRELGGWCYVSVLQIYITTYRWMMSHKCITDLYNYMLVDNVT